MDSNIKFLRTKTFNFMKYVKNFYVEDGVAYISCNTRNISDIISSYSVKDYEWLNNDFISYIESNAYYIPLKYPITIELCGGYFSDTEKTIITKTIQDYFGLKLGDKQLDLNINTKKSLSLLLLGLISSISSYFVVKGFYEWILILFWFFIWTLCDVFIFERHKIKMEKLEAAQLATVNVIFSDVTDLKM